MKMKNVLILVLCIATVWSCNNDDDEGNIIIVPPQSLTETAAEDDAKIREFLQTHFYNYEEFDSPPADFDYKIKLDTIAGDNANKKPLIDSVKVKEIKVSSDRFSGLDEEGDVIHKLYYLVPRQGAGENPTVADSTYVRYEGSLLNGDVFDGSSNQHPVWFDLASIQGSGARGFTEGASFIKAGGDIIINQDGTFAVEDYGVGLVIFPSGLGYYNNAQASIPSYSPLIFTIDVFAVNDTDHDNDGILSINEDLNGDGYLYNDNTDEDTESSIGQGTLFPNFFDADDDGDGIGTIDEIDIDEEGNVTFRDTDGDGINDHLDSDS